MKRIELRKISRQLYEATLRQGDDAEKFVVGLLEEGNAQGKLPPWILGWNHHEKWKYHDINGIDLTIYTDSGEILVNVKSSYNFIKKFMKLHGDQDIVIFVVDLREDRSRALGRLIHYLGRRYKKFSAC